MIGRRYRTAEHETAALPEMPFDDIEQAIHLGPHRLGQAGARGRIADRVALVLQELGGVHGGVDLGIHPGQPRQVQRVVRRAGARRERAGMRVRDVRDDSGAFEHEPAISELQARHIAERIDLAIGAAPIFRRQPHHLVGRADFLQNALRSERAPFLHAIELIHVLPPSTLADDAATRRRRPLAEILEDTQQIAIRILHQELAVAAIGIAGPIPRLLDRAEQGDAGFLEARRGSDRALSTSICRLMPRPYGRSRGAVVQKSVSCSIISSAPPRSR